MKAFIVKQVHLSPLLSCLLLYTSTTSARASNKGWASLPIVVPNGLDENFQNSYTWARTQVTIGTPPQTLDLVVNFEESLFTTWSCECAFCPLNDADLPFFPDRSSTLQSEDGAWELESSTAHGSWYKDVAGFGKLRAEDVPFVLMEELSIFYPGVRLLNGQLGLWSNSTFPRKTLSQLWDQGALLNPVIGIRLDLVRPRITIGALDPEDYVGEINWVEVRGARARARPGQAEGDESASEGWREDAFVIDGLKGYNGSFIPFDTQEISATLSSFFRNVVVPPEVYGQYYSNPDYISPDLTVENGDRIICPNATTNDQLPPAPFTVTINGVDYPLVEAGNWIRKTWKLDKCGIGLVNYTTAMNTGSTRTRPVTDVELGLPFMRSVYIAYRFPTSDSPDCLPHIGFAFPSNMNHTAEQINQQPRTLPPLRDRCLSLSPPIGEPLSNISQSQTGRASGAYRVYGDASRGRQVQLVGANELRRRT